MLIAHYNPEGVRFAAAPAVFVLLPACQTVLPRVATR